MKKRKQIEGVREVNKSGRQEKQIERSEKGKVNKINESSVGSHIADHLTTI